MAATVRALRGGTPALAGLALLLAGFLGAGCTSQEATALSALHYFQRGNAAYQAEDYRRAIEHFSKALEFDDQAPDIHYNLGLAYYRVGAYEAAVKAYQGAIRLDATFADAQLNLALAYDKLYNAALAHTAYNHYRALITGTKAEAPAAVQARDAEQPAGRAQAQNGGTPTAAAPPARARMTPVGTAPVGTAPGGPEQAPNPFEGNSKWWTQDTANPSR